MKNVILIVTLVFGVGISSAYAAIRREGIWDEIRSVEDPMTSKEGVSTTYTRSLYYLPSSAGRLVSITVLDGKPVFWLEDTDGSIRNVFLNTTQPVLIKR